MTRHSFFLPSCCLSPWQSSKAVSSKATQNHLAQDQAHSATSGIVSVVGGFPGPASNYPHHTTRALGGIAAHLLRVTMHIPPHPRSLSLHSQSTPCRYTTIISFRSIQYIHSPFNSLCLCRVLDQRLTTLTTAHSNTHTILTTNKTHFGVTAAEGHPEAVCELLQFDTEPG